MNTVYVSEVLESQKAISTESGELILSLVLTALSSNENVIVDFSNIRQYTTMFFNAFVANLIINHITQEEFEKRVTLTGLSALGNATYEKSYNNALKFDKNTASIINEIVNAD